MVEFINVKDSKKKINYDNVDIVIIKMNKAIKKEKYSINNVLDDFMLLNDEEFKIAQERANKAGWTISKFNDNYDTISYKIFPTNKS